MYMISLGLKDRRIERYIYIYIRMKILEYVIYKKKILIYFDKIIS